MKESSFADEVHFMIPINIEERGKDPQTQARIFLLAALWWDIFGVHLEKVRAKNEVVTSLGSKLYHFLSVWRVFEVK